MIVLGWIALIVAAGALVIGAQAAVIESAGRRRRRARGRQFVAELADWKAGELDERPRWFN